MEHSNRYLRNQCLMLAELLLDKLGDFTADMNDKDNYAHNTIVLLIQEAEQALLNDLEVKEREPRNKPAPPPIVVKREGAA